MHPISLLAPTIQPDGPLPTDPIDGVCCVTGLVGPCLPRRLSVPESSTDQLNYLAPTSDLCGVDAYRVLRYRPERAACWWCDGHEFRPITRPDILALVLDGSTRTPWAAWVTTSYKKHGAFRAVVNPGPRGVVAFDERRVDCSDGSQISEWWDRMTAAQRAGIWRTMQERVECHPALLGKIGLDVWVSFERWARPRAQSGLYALLCYLLPSREEARA